MAYSEYQNKVLYIEIVEVINMKGLLLLLVIVLASCSIAGSDTGEGPVSLRKKNTGYIDFQSVKMGFTGPEFYYDELAAGQTSGYQLFEEACHYGYIAVEAEGKVYSIMPVDYVGESSLKPGQYTYELKIDGNDLEFRFER